MLDSHIVNFYVSERPCPLNCANGGTCMDGKCSCPQGYQGSFCQIGSKLSSFFIYFCWILHLFWTWSKMGVWLIEGNRNTDIKSGLSMEMRSLRCSELQRLQMSKQLSDNILKNVHIIGEMGVSWHKGFVEFFSFSLLWFYKIKPSVQRYN